MKLYLTSERHASLPAAVCTSAVSARRVSPPSLPVLWRESVQLRVPSAVVPASVPVSSALVSSALVPSALVPSARVAAEATGSVRVDLTVRGTEPGGKAEIRTDVTDGTTGIDQHHVASAARVGSVASAAQLDQRGVRVQGTTGFSAKHDMTAPKPNGGVRGIPPRGRPV